MIFKREKRLDAGRGNDIVQVIGRKVILSENTTTQCKEE